MNVARVSVESNGERGEDGAAIAFASAVDRSFDVLETGLHRDPVAGQERELSGTARQSLEGRQAIRHRELPDRVHSRIEIHGRQPRAPVADFGNAQANLHPHIGERIGGHETLLFKRKVSDIG